MILSLKCRRLSQIVLTRSIYPQNCLIFSNNASARYKCCHGNATFQRCSSPSRSYHGSIHSKHVDVLSKSWGSHLTTFEQYQYQSDLSQPSIKGPRLLDEPAFNTDWDLWLELIIFQRRQRNIDKVRALYHETTVRDLCIPTIGAIADELWSLFLYLGWETRTVWEVLIPYARRLQERTGGSWQPLYAKILTRILKSAPQDASLWHTRLRDTFKPSSADMKAIFRNGVSSEATLQVFKRMYLDFSYRDLYSTVIPQLCRDGNYKRALQWHHMMITASDIPSSTEIAKPLSHHLAIHGTSDELILMTKSMASADVPVPAWPASVYQSLPIKKATISELFNRQLGVAHNISPKALSDEFCARLFATPVFPVNTLIKAIHMLGVDTLGPTSLRELVSRELKSRTNSSSRPISQCLDKLKETGISIDDSIFCTVIGNLAVQGDERLLEEVISCDMCPDAFEDRDLQESLLAKYYAHHDHLQISRTLAILTAKCKPENLQSTLMNLILRSALKRKDKQKIHQQLDMMQEKMVPLCARSVRVLRRGLLSPRAVSEPPASKDELPRVVAIYQGILRAGGDVQFNQWREILLRLGMTGLLSELEKLSLWLAEWYSNPSFRASESSLFQPTSEQVLEDLPARNPRHPLRVIFSDFAQQAIVAWSFQRSGELYEHQETIRDGSFTWRWGSKLLSELQHRKVVVLRNTVSRAYRLRFIALVGHGTSRRVINRTARAISIDQVMDMAQEIEKIHGSAIFFPDYRRLPLADARRLEILKQQILFARIHTDPIQGGKLRPYGRKLHLIQKPHPLIRLERRSQILKYTSQKGRFDYQKWLDDHRKYPDDDRTWKSDEQNGDKENGRERSHYHIPISHRLPQPS